jgi:hypothetical protein
VEVHVDGWDLEAGVLVSAESPANQTLMLGVGAKHADRVGDDHGSRSRLRVYPSAGERRGRQDRDQEPRCDLRTHVGTVEHGSCGPIEDA